MPIVGKPHLYEDCTARTWYNEVWKDHSFKSGNKSGLWTSQLCTTCLDRAGMEGDDVDDFNSVWFGLGPDMILSLV